MTIRRFQGWLTTTCMATALATSVLPPATHAGSGPGVEGPERRPQFTLPASPGASADHCTLRLLGELGWRFSPGDAPRLDGHEGHPCDRNDLADAHAHGDLLATLPANDADGGQRSADLRALLQNPATHCAYGFRLGDATRRAVDRLVANPGFRFSALQTGWIGFGSGGARRDGWESIRSFGRGFRPTASPSRAIDGFYGGSVRAECGVGRQIAQYATQHELYGAASFDAEFSRDEIVVGTFNQLHGTRSILLGSEAGEFTRDGRARKASLLGRQAFAGLPGFIVHAMDRSLLDDTSNQAQNFVVYDVSTAAAAALRLHGGFEHYNQRARELWQLSRSLDLTTRRVYERLLHEHDASLRAAMPPRKLRVIEAMDAILVDPFFQGFRVYVHPKGVRPVGYHFARMLDRNPRTSFRIELGLHNLHTTLYQRWIAHRLAHCEAVGAEPNATAPPGGVAVTPRP